jgi:hypothetical protein
MTQLQKDQALGFLYLLLEKTRYASQKPEIFSETWATAIMAKKCGLITKSSCDRILSYLDNKEKEIC